MHGPFHILLVKQELLKQLAHTLTGHEAALLMVAELRGKAMVDLLLGLFLLFSSKLLRFGLGSVQPGN